MEIPTWLAHKPIIAVDYEQKDASYGDAKFLSIGRSSWNEEDCSAKIWRKTGDEEKWSRQSEEMPLWRVLDLAKLLISVITGNESTLEPECVNLEDMEFLKSFINENMEIYAPRLNEIKEILEKKVIKEKSIKQPNLFNIATSELSQDAMLAWLLMWADESYKDLDHELFHLGQNTVALLTGITPSDIHKVQVQRQWNNIDIYAEINDNIFLAVEDKTETSIHDDQLNRYKEAINVEYGNKRNKLFFAYVKTGNEPKATLKIIAQQGYKPVNRTELLEVLNQYKGNNPIVIDYKSHLQNIENQTNGFTEMPVNDWGYYEWQGFYKTLEDYLDVKDWSYVSNPNGGFQGLWWHFIENEEIEMYLQFEECKLCFKIHYEGDENRSEIRNKYYNKLMDKVESSNPEIEKPSRFGAGTYMTIGVVSPDNIFGQGLIDIKTIIRKLKCYEKIIDNCME
jgi:hypothetical protein